MSPFDQAIVPILVVAAVLAVGCFLVAWLDIAIHRRPKARPHPAEMRRHMLCGFYCNPEDPRPVVHRPIGRGYTINLRRELLAVTLVVMTMIAIVAGMLLYAMPAQ
jgi:uncharacterized membrane protein